MKILITTIFFPPQNAIASQRPYSWARAWSDAGHDVTVLTIAKDLSRADLSPARMDGFSTINAPTRGLVGWLRRWRSGNRGLKHTLAVQAPSEAMAKPRTRAASGLAIWLRRRGFLSSIRWPDVFDFSIPSMIAQIPDEEFDLIVSTFGPPASLAVGYWAKKKNSQAKWICDFRDLWSENHVYPGFWPIKFFERWAERHYLNAADGVTTVSEALARTLARLSPTRTPVEVFENGYMADEIDMLESRSIFAGSHRLHLVYTGSLHPDQRNPLTLFQALLGLDPSARAKVEVVFVGPVEVFVKTMIAEMKLDDCVRVFSSVPRHDSLRYQRDADLLLFFEKQHAKAHDGVLTGKLFEYLASGRPIWALGIDGNSTVGEFIESNRVGIAFGDSVDKVLGALKSLIAGERTQSRDVHHSADVSRQYDRTIIAERMLSWMTSLPHRRR